jgi:DNA-binding GntR family transcriptional regulator
MNIIANIPKQDFAESEILEYKSLSDITTEKIRKEIIIGKLLPGTKITEKNISDRLGVSRIVIREAIIRLVKEGLFIKEKNKYTKVVEFNRKDIMDIFELRIALETAAANKCIELNKMDLNELKSRSEVISRSVKRQRLRDIEQLVRNDIAFHEFIIISSDNKKLIDVWQGLSSQVLMLLYKYVINIKKESENIKLSYDHSRIILPLIKGDKSKLQRVIADHINDTKQFLLNNY